MFRQMMLNMDHPGHTRLRRILQPIFTPRSVATAARVDRATTRARSSTASAASVDLVTTVSAEMPLRVLADLFGMPREDRHLIFEWSNALLGADNPERRREHADEARWSRLASDDGVRPGDGGRPPGRPRDDIVSRIVNAEVDGERLTDTEFQMFWLLLVIAGNETTRNAVSGSVVALHGARAVGLARRAPRAPADRGRRAPPVRVAGPAVPPHRHRRHRPRRPAGAGRRQGRDLVRRRQPRPRRVRRPARARPAARARTRTSRSASAPTSASVPTWPASR